MCGGGENCPCDQKPCEDCDCLEQIPDVNSIPEAELPDESSYDFQLQKSLNEMKKISKDKSSVSLVFNAHVHGDLVQKLEEKGYVVKYTSDYNSSRKPQNMISKLKIVNPKLCDQTSNLMDSFEENLKKLGFSSDSTDTEENFKKLFSGFMKF